MHGKLTREDITPVKRTAIHNFSSKGMKPEATVMAIVQALGLIH